MDYRSRAWPFSQIVFAACLAVTISLVMERAVFAQLRARTPINYVDFSADGKLFAAAYGHQVAVWHLGEQWEVRQVARLRHKSVVACLGFSPDGKRLVVSGQVGKRGSKGFVTFWSTRDFGSKDAEFTSDSCVECLTFSRNGKHMLTGNDNGQVKHFLVSGEGISKVSAFRLTEQAIVSMAISPDQQYVATGARGKTVKIWRWPVTPGIAPIRVIEQSDASYFPCLRFTQDSRYACAAPLAIRAFAYSVEGPEKDYPLPFLGYEKPSENAIGCLDLSPDDRFLAVGYCNGRIRVYEKKGTDFRPLGLKLGQNVPTSGVPLNRGIWPSRVRFLAFCPTNDRVLISGSEEGEVCLWRLPDVPGATAKVRYMRNVAMDHGFFLEERLTPAQINVIREIADRNRLGKWMDVEIQYPEGAPDEIRELVGQLNGEDAEAARTALLDANEVAIPALIAALNAESWRLRYNAVLTLKSMGPQAAPALSALAAALADGDSSVVSAAEAALVSVKTVAVPEILRVIRMQDVQLTRSAREVIVRIGPAALPQLIDSLRETRMWYEVEQISSQLGAPAEAALIDALGDEKRNANVRAGAAWTLGELALPATAARREALLNARDHDTDQRVRKLAATALKQIDG